MNAPTGRPRRKLLPPSGFEGHVGRHEAAALLGLPSEFKVRQLEKAGRLRSVRGPMGSAWYPRADVLALRPLLAEPTPAAEVGLRRAPTDAELLALLRAGGKSPVDLVVETGIGIGRAQKVHRFWLAHERPPAPGASPPELAAPPPAVTPPEAPPAPLERRSPERRARAALIRQLRDPDPRLRAAAFAALRPR